MALHNAHRPATLRARLNRLERELQPYETDAQRYSKALKAHWLATSPEAAELVAEYEDVRQSYGAIGMLAYEAGQELITAMLDDLYDTLEPLGVIHSS